MPSPLFGACEDERDGKGPSTCSGPGRDGEKIFVRIDRNPFKVSYPKISYRLATTPSSRLYALSPGLRGPGAARSTSFDVLDSHRSPRETLSQRSLHERVQIAIENVSGGARDLPCAKVFHHLIGLEHIRADLVTPADIGL